MFIRSGIRFDYLINDKDDTFFYELCKYHVSGQLKVAPEHISNAVLEKMGKPSVEVYKKFVKAYKDMNEKLGKKQYLVPYLMSSHPGSTLKEAVELAEFCAILVTCRNRYRILSDTFYDSQPVCIIPDWIHARWNRFMSLSIHMKKRCRGR